MAHIQHIYGKQVLDCNADQAIVVCVVKDGEPWIESFIKHYQAIGFSHLVFLDNDSADRTIEIAASFPDITVLHSDASFSENKTKFKFALIKNFGIGCWSLIADIDEFFYYPNMDSISLDQFLNYQNEHRYDCVVTQMLDMVPDCTFAQLMDNPIQSINDASWYFDLQEIDKKDYSITQNRISNPQIKQWYGGVRKRLFRLEDLLLTKHPLIFGQGEIVFLSSHSMGKRFISDVSSVFLHYKYIGDIHARTIKAVEEKNYYRESQEYRIYLNQLKKSPETQFIDSHSIEYTGIDCLSDMEVYDLSNQYNNYINNLSDS